MAVALLVGAGAFLALALSRSQEERADPAPVVERTPDTGRIRVEVLNAGGRDGMARLATQHLRDRGFDVVYLGNARRYDRDTSVVLARGGDQDAAALIARSLGIEAIRAEPDSSRYVDVSVLLGTDWGPDGGGADESGGEQSRWWDVRRLFGRGGP